MTAINAIKYDYRWQLDPGASGRKMRVLPPQIAESGMPRYFFDIHNGSGLSRDSIGTECDGMDGIRYEAMQALPAIARDEIPRDGDRQAFTALVRDENNITVYTATITFAGLWIGTEIPSTEERL